MTGMLDHDSASLILVESDGGLSPTEIGVSPQFGAGREFAVFEVNPPLGSMEVVRLVRDESIPEDVAVVSSALAERMELEPESSAWRLRSEGLEHIQAAEMQLELGVECPVEEAVWRLERSARLRGSALLVRGGDVEATSLEIDGLGLRVSYVEPAPSQSDALVEITDRTRLTLHVPGTRTGVDVVILADCSGSMSLQDLEVSVQPEQASRGFLSRFTRSRASATRPMKRMEAVRLALEKLLRVRLESTGRSSRIALIEFTDKCKQVFPLRGGMVEIDGDVSPAVIDEFRNAVNLLDARDAATRIGNALRAAVELLVREGRPANERLIVLISDGADWQPKRQEDAGEMVIGIDEPVSLMDGYHNDNLRVHLHAIGVSSEEIFWPWWKKTHGTRTPASWMLPNHRLLEELVKVGGGDPARTGDTDVLLEYFSSLGSGIERSLRCDSKVHAGRLSRAGRDAIRKHLDQRHTVQLRDELKSIAERCATLVMQINDRATQLANQPAFQLAFAEHKYFHESLPRPAVDHDSFSSWISKLYQRFLDTRDERIARKKMDYAVPAVRGILHGEATGWINEMRNFYHHPLDVESAHRASKETGTKRERMASLLERLIGRPVFDEDDPAAWGELQLAIARVLLRVLEDADVCYQEAFQEKAARPEPAPELAASGGMRILYHQPSRSRR